jgi:hypothetical protein
MLAHVFVVVEPTAKGGLMSVSAASLLEKAKAIMNAFSGANAEDHTAIRCSYYLEDSYELYPTLALPSNRMPSAIIIADGHWIDAPKAKMSARFETLYKALPILYPDSYVVCFQYEPYVPSY